MKLEVCPFCHQEVASHQFADHCAEHSRLQPDGQQKDYATLPPDERTDQSLDGVPQVYHHRKCGASTGMPEEIIRTYLVNPYFYLADHTFCAGCKSHVPYRELIWVETGEDLQSYFNRLRAEKPECRPGLFTRLLVLLLNQKWI